jgi:hypothetical protein
MTNKKKQDIRLNNDLRKAYVQDFRRFLESHTDNPKYQEYDSALKVAKVRIADAFKTAKKVVERAYIPEDVATFQKLQRRYSTVDATSKDSCFYFAVVDSKGKQVKELDEYNDEVSKKRHFDFNLQGSMTGSQWDKQNEFAQAFYRTEMKQVGLNPDCSIENSDKHQNPHLTIQQNKISDWIKGDNGASGDLITKWKNDYSLDIIGSGGCRSRAIPCTEKEFAVFELMLLAKQNLVKAHEEWIGAIVKAQNAVAETIKSCRTKSEIDSIAKEYNWKPNVSINKTFGTAMVVDPRGLKSITDTILGYTKKQTREEKIAIARQALAQTHSKLAN